MASKKKWYKWTYLQNRNSLTDLENELTIASEGEWGKEAGSLDRRVHTAIFKMDNQQGPTIQHRELCSMLCGSLDGWGVWGRMDKCICMAESLCCPPENIIILLIGDTEVYFFKKRIWSV